MHQKVLKVLLILFMALASPCNCFLTLNTNFTMCRPHVILTAGYNQEVNLMTQPSLYSFVQCIAQNHHPPIL